MSSPNKNPKRKEVIFKSSVFLSLLLFSILIASYLARGTPPQTTDAAATRYQGNRTVAAFSYGTMDKFKNAYNTKNSGDGVPWKNYGAKFNFKGTKLYKEGGGYIDLTKKLGTRKNSPYRYWFWMKANKLADPKSTHWSTDRFVVTTQTIDGNDAGYNSTGFNSLQYEDRKGDSVPVSRIVVKANEADDSLYQYEGGGTYGICLYVLDLQEWADKGGLDADTYTGRLFVQTVASIYSAEGKHLGGPYYTLSSWKSGAIAHGFRSTGIAEYYQHYNQYINLKYEAPKHNLRFFRIQTSDKSETTAKLGDYSLGNRLWYTNDKKIEVYDDSVLNLKGIKTYKTGDKTYYLKGIRICNRGETETDKGHFYILTNTFKGGPLATREGADKKTDKYCKSNGSGYQLDKLSERNFGYFKRYKFSFDYNKEKGTYKFSKTVTDKEVGEVTNPKNPGKKGDGSYKELDWETLTDHMVDLSLKTGSEDQDIYLIYEAQNKGQVKVQKAYYDHTDDNETDGISSYEKVEEDEEPKVLGDFKADDDTAKYSIKDAITLERRKIIDNTNNNLGFTWNQYSNLNDKVSSGTASQAESDKFADWNEQIRKHRALWSYHNRKVKDTKGNTSSERYYARRVSVKYTSKKTGEKVEVNIGGTVKNLDALLAADSNFDNAIWSGKSDEAKALADSILKVLRAFEFDDVDKSKELLIKIDYYQSKVQYKALTYIEYMKQAFNVVYTIIYKTD
ncbi:MAG: hypothetical protein II374_01155 [Lachnospiraceae bacterium]|nr:hypothetical protein [Lachnospiraceae bacterium]